VVKFDQSIAIDQVVSKVAMVHSYRWFVAALKKLALLTKYI
jgi:hypothetical protein